MEYTEFTYRIGHTINNYNIMEEGCYGSHCGITDLYSNCEKNLKTLLDSGEEFRAEWGSKKELLSACVMRANDKLIISVRNWIDDLWESDDLIYDAYYDACGKEDDIPEEWLEEIRNCAFEVGCNDFSEASWSGDSTKSYEEIMDIISNLADKASTQCEEYYKMLNGVVSEIIGGKK